MNIDSISSSLLTKAQAAAASADKSTSGSFSLEMSLVVEKTETTPKETTVEDVKKEFWDYLNSLDITQSGSICVLVSDSAWERMTTDPEYKQKMMDLCKRDLCDPAWNRIPNPAGTVIRITTGGSEDYIASSVGGLADKSGAKSDGKGFWERRAERNKEAHILSAERAQQRREQERAGLMRYLSANISTGGLASTSSPSGGESILSDISLF